MKKYNFFVKDKNGNIVRKKLNISINEIDTLINYFLDNNLSVFGSYEIKEVK